MTYDYGQHAPDPPTADEIAIRDQLAEEWAAATDKAEKRAAMNRLIDHMRETVGMPLEHFSTSGDRAIEVNVSLSKPRMKTGCETEARAWLKGRGNVESLARKLARKGASLPLHLFDPVETNLRINLPKKKR